MVERKFLKAQNEFSLFDTDDKILVGFSGGSDSVLLVILLLKFKKNLKIKEIVLAHINHMLRGEDSFKDEEFCKEFAKKHNLKIFVKRVDVKEISKKEKKSIEETAREIRYSFFNEILEKEKLNKIATGHHLSDLAETMTLWFIQGNKKGLKGFKPKEGKIVRPLYFIKKEEIEDYLKDRKIDYRVDVSNIEIKYLRNKVRHQLIPKMKEINPSLEESLMKMSNFLHLDDEFLEKESEKLLSSFDERIDLQELKKYNLALIYRALQKWIHKKTGVYISYSQLIDILDLITKDGSKTFYIGKDYLLVKEYNSIFIKKSSQLDEKKYFEYKFKIGETLYIKELGMVVKSFKKEKVNIEELAKKDNLECFDIPNFKGDEEFIIRSRKEGDRFVPFGKKTEKKLKDILIDLKISKYMRQNIPLLVFRNKILWVIGYKRSAYFPVKPDSKNIVCFEFKEV